MGKTSDANQGFFKERLSGHETTWRGGPIPPSSLVDYIQVIRNHTLDRTFNLNRTEKDTFPASNNGALARNVSVGMNVKKRHEVENFSRYISDLISDMTVDESNQITHIVDFGSGQNYLGRALASPPYNKKIVALESKHLNIDGAKGMDVTAKLAKKEKRFRNKKQYRVDTLTLEGKSQEVTRDESVPAGTLPSTNRRQSLENQQILPTNTSKEQCDGNVQYIESVISNGDLSSVIKQLTETSNDEWKGNTIESRADSGSSTHLVPKSPTHELQTPDSTTVNKVLPTLQLMVVSLHSCGNLLHHGLRSLVLNPSVKAVAMVGCCYNLVTERLGPPSYKIPALRPSHPRLDRTSDACDPHGFPMSNRLTFFRHQHGEGIRLNITARMMAVQAPQNWTITESEAFFKRHFYRALLQRIFVDYGVVEKPAKVGSVTKGGSPRGWSGVGQAIIIGSLRKACYTSFTTYVRGAIAKLVQDGSRGSHIAQCMQDLSDDDIMHYEDLFRDKKKDLSVIWSLMAFSAGVVESTIVIDRWLYLREQKEVKECWVETVFEHQQSPRNFVVVGVKQ
ncbi:hypothetical protein MMC12_006218 [Toensbergia leucococca]|nr:hypothetical protein [Toensbergia leucococca]